VVKLVVRVRQRLEKSAAGLINAREIQPELVRRHRLKPPPSQATIKRWLRQAGLIATPAESDKAAYYPAPNLGDDLVIFACDWAARYFKGGEKVFVFHTIDHRSHALAQREPRRQDYSDSLSTPAGGLLAIGPPGLLAN